jgi:hypothetical protein
MSGTSQATAFVTGAAALIASQAGPGSFDYRKVKSWVLDGAKPMKLNANKQLLAAGLLSIPGSLQAQRTFLTKNPPVKPAKSSAPEVAAVPPAPNPPTQTR